MPKTARDAASDDDDDDYGRAAPAAKKPRARELLPRSAHAGPPPTSLIDGVSRPAASLQVLAKALPPKQPGAIKIACFNVNGLRATFRKEEGRRAGMGAWLAAEAPDVLALQEIKCTRVQADELMREAAFTGAFSSALSFWNESRDTRGYAGTALLVSRAAAASGLLSPIGVGYGTGVAAHDGTGRVTTVEFGAFYLCNVYAPNSGEKLLRLGYRTREWDVVFRAFVGALRGRGTLPGVVPASTAEARAGPSPLAGFLKGGAAPTAPAGALPQLSLAPKPVLIVGDFNVCHLDCDMYNADSQRNKVAGFCDGERDGFGALLADGFVDVFRAANPITRQYTYWSAKFGDRENNRGWRLDYALVGQVEAAAATTAAADAAAAVPSPLPSSSSGSVLAPGKVAVEVRGDWPGPSDHVPIIVTIQT